MLVLIFVGGSLILFFGVLTSVQNPGREYMTREQKSQKEYEDTTVIDGGCFF